MRHRKTLPWLAAVACFATACAGTSGTTQSTASTPSSASGPSSAARSSAAAEKRNKALVLRLYAEAFNKNRGDVVTGLVATGFVQHEKSVSGGPEGQIEQFENLRARIPGAVATVKHVAADGDLVAVHWQASATPADEATGVARADLYRVARGKLVEHWGITQTVPPKTASGNSLFGDAYRYPKGTPSLSEQQEERNRKFAVTAYRQLSDGDVTVIDRKWDPRYYQHNPMIPDGTGPLKRLLRQDTQDAPSTNDKPGAGDSPGAGGRTRFGNTLADGDLVWVFSVDHVVADLFRVVDGKIIEHWDVVADGQ
ncbi:ester cyclase [Streptomyces scabiei]|uniref:nuclear transport factor 2 family protein n=1 Tax=Streptomyces scabiei TaxID=1930 RepID=UPI00298FE66B|nr:ester cyclase [Streptomyces scabiei]MDW8804968.1 ester cyclase [Streptomyces scabiei]